MSSDVFLQRLWERRPELQTCEASIREAFALMTSAIERDGKLLLCGNGGSAADADHWSGELLKGFRLARPVRSEVRRRLPEESRGFLQGAIAAIPLGAFHAALSAYANDVRAEFGYAQLVFALGRPGDVFIGLSTSGNAANVRAAARVARAQGLHVLGLTGRGGGRLAPECDVCIRVPADETFAVQELHLAVYHTLSLMLEETFFAEASA